MEDRHIHPVDRAALEVTIENALRESRHLWPKTRLPGDHDRHKPIALAVVDHLDLCRMRVFRRPSSPAHTVIATPLHQARARFDPAGNFTVPIPRPDLEFSIRFALDDAERLWPSRRRRGDGDSLRPMAAAVVDHLEASGWRVFMAARTLRTVRPLPEYASGGRPR